MTDQLRRVAPYEPTTPRSARPSVVMKGVTKHYGDRAVLDGFELTIADGELVAVLGPSGTGKTTLLRLLLGLERVDAGRLLVPHNRSVVFQEPRLVQAQRVWRNLVLDERRSRAGLETATAALAEVGLAGKARAWPRTLSGGEAQRVALARALITRPDLLLLDEPFAALDALTRITMHRLVRDLWIAHRPTIVLVTHDVDEALALADRIVFLDGGRVRRDWTISAERPRDPAAPWFRELKGLLLKELGVADV